MASIASTENTLLHIPKTALAMASATAHTTSIIGVTQTMMIIVHERFPDCIRSIRPMAGTASA